MNNKFSLENKTILVTGASSGIGRETAILCSQMGAKVIITGRNEERLQETMNLLEKGKDHLQIKADLTVSSDFNSLIDNIPNIDGLVLCAGKSMTSPVLYSTKDKFQDLYEVNLFTPFELLRQLAKTKKLVKGGSVVALLSVGGSYRRSVGNAIYGSAKSALETLVKYSAVEFGPKRIRVNGVCPGMVDTPFIHEKAITEEQLEEERKNYPLGRLGQPEDIAYGVVYLLSDASSWVSGQSLIIDGGITAK